MYFTALFLTAMIAALLVALGLGLRERVLELSAFLHRTLTGIVTNRSVDGYGVLLCKVRH